MRLSHVTLSKLLSISRLQFPHLENCGNYSAGARMDLRRGVFLWAAALPVGSLHWVTSAPKL